MRLSPDGSIRVELAAVEWSNTHWVARPGVIEVASGRILLDLWGTDWDAGGRFRSSAVSRWMSALSFRWWLPGDAASPLPTSLWSSSSSRTRQGRRSAVRSPRSSRRARSRRAAQQRRRAPRGPDTSASRPAAAPDHAGYPGQCTRGDRRDLVCRRQACPAGPPPKLSAVPAMPHRGVRGRSAPRATRTGLTEQGTADRCLEGLSTSSHEGLARPLDEPSA